MRQLLNKGLKISKRKQLPDDGVLLPLFTHEPKNGWYYQVDLLHDSRVKESPCVTVHAFKPPKNYFAHSADYYLCETVKRKKQ